MPVRPHGTFRPPLYEFSWNFIFEYLSNICRANPISVEKIQVPLPPDKNDGYFIWRLCTFMVVSHWILPRMKYTSDQSFRENQNSHFMFKNILQKPSRLWDNVKKYGRTGEVTDDNKILHARIACWITKATDTHLYYIILNNKLYVHCLSCP
jgi:hypothetical protein